MLGGSDYGPYDLKNRAKRGLAGLSLLLARELPRGANRTIRLVRRAAVLIVVTGFLASCDHPKVPPERPPGVPTAAVWAGGLDRGSFILCVTDPSSRVNRCTVYNDYTGQVMETGDFRLKVEDRAARVEELKYAWADRGGMIGLADGRLLVGVHPAKQ